MQVARKQTLSADLHENNDLKRAAGLDVARFGENIMEFIVDSLASLEQLRGGRSAIRRIRLAGPLADFSTERALNRAYFACGCEQGSVTVMAVLVASVLLGLIRGFDGAFAWWCILLYLAAAALIGKAAGLTIARLRLARLYSQLRSRAAAHVS